jgi:hypothetical protein
MHYRATSWRYSGGANMPSPHGLRQGFSTCVTLAQQLLKFDNLSLTVN